MEGKEVIEKRENNFDTEKISKKQSSRKKSIKEKALTIALVGGLLTGSGGCNVEQNNKQKNLDPIITDSIENVVNSEGETALNDEILIERDNILKLPLETNDTFQLNLSDFVVHYIENVASSHKGEILKYPVFETKEGQNHKDKVNDFVQSLINEELEVGNPLHLDFNYTEWKFSEGKISYSGYNNFLEINLNNPIKIFDIDLDFENEKSIEEGLKKMTSGIIDVEFGYRVDEIIEQEDYYKVNFSRLLGNIPVYEIRYPLYMIISKEGKLKEGRFWLREFEKVGEVELISAQDFTQNFNSADYPKTISYDAPGISTPEDSEIPFHGWVDPLLKNKKGGVIDLTEIELVYYYRFFREKFQNKNPTLPMFLLKGKGVKNPQEFVNEKPEEITGKVLANAISFENIKK